ncbi:MAG: vanadium-dependent haloperoxidase [Saprospiraceae bacterium]|nr:vanadium-dependent haloperoxidase [Saprospiraceae bacterium]MBP7699388.1 vanadium-dependent haloperoxidase [Saprospiraceae bacterium]
MKKIILFLLGTAMLTTQFSCDSTVDPPVDPVSVSAAVNTYNSDVLVQWNEKFMEVERYAQFFRPLPAPRALAYIGIGLYEGCIKGMPDYNSMINQYPGLTLPAQDLTKEYHYPTVVNNIYGALMYSFFSQDVQLVSPSGADITAQELLNIVTHRANINNQFQSEISQDVFNRSKAYGEAVANAVFEYAETDAIGNRGHVDPFRAYNWQANPGAGYGYTAVDHGLWQPSSPSGNGLFNYGGDFRTFAIRETDKISEAPLVYGEAAETSTLYSQALEVYTKTNSANFTSEDEHSAEFWSDDIVTLTFGPPTRWIAISNQVYTNDNVSLETAIYCNVKVGLAINDAGVAAWKSKFHYNIERPFSFIHRLIDPSWTTRLDNPYTPTVESLTPSFPAFPSGHATFGAAAAEVLTDIFGLGYVITDACHDNRNEFSGAAATFSSFYKMAEENALSRIPLGVHFRMDSEAGLHLGQLCGERVNKLNWKKN